MPLKTVSTVVCGGCHTDAHHPTYDEWAMSRHGNALEGLKASGHAQDHCLTCHSEDYRYAVANGLPEIPTVHTAQLSLECSTCHAPHGGVEQAYLIRKPLDQLCGECHTQGEATLGGNPHHPQFEMLTGIGAFQADGSPLVQPHPHSVIAKSCAQCHVVRHQVDAPNEGNPNVTGHTFNPFDGSIDQDLANQYGGCVDCHEITVAFENRREAFQDLIASQITALRPYFTAGTPQYIDPASLTEADLTRWESARFNVLYVEADSSGGMHNFENARVALSIADSVFKSLSSNP
jgi:predicted CXXCH cytochrome family protein